MYRGERERERERERSKKTCNTLCTGMTIRFHSHGVCTALHACLHVWGTACMQPQYHLHKSIIASSDSWLSLPAGTCTMSYKHSHYHSHCRVHNHHRGTTDLYHLYHYWYSSLTLRIDVCVVILHLPLCLLSCRNIIGLVLLPCVGHLDEVSLLVKGALQYNTIQNYTIQDYTILYYAMLYYTILALWHSAA